MLCSTGMPAAGSRQLGRMSRSLGARGPPIVAPGRHRLRARTATAHRAGVLVDGVLQRWLAHSPSTWLRDPARVATFAPLSGNIYLTVGDSDDFDLAAPTVTFSQQLTAVGIANQLVMTHGGHSTCERPATPVHSRHASQHVTWAGSPVPILSR